MIADAKADPAVAEKVWLEARAIFDNDTPNDIYRLDRPLADSLFKERAPGKFSPRSRPKIFVSVHSTRLWGLALLALVLSGVSAFIALQDRRRTDQFAAATSQIEELSSNMTALKERVSAISADQTQLAPRGEMKADEAQLRNSIEHVSDRLDHARSDFQARDAGMELRLSRLEVNEPSASARPASLSSPTDRAATGEPVAGQSSSNGSIIAAAPITSVRERVTVPLGESAATKKNAKIHKRARNSVVN